MSCLSRFQLLLLRLLDFSLSAAGFLYYFFIFALLIAITLHAIIRSQQKANRLRLPPGPRCFPIVGNLLQIGAIPHLGLMKFTKKFGPLVYLRIGMVPAVVTDDPYFVKEFLKKQDHIFASRPTNIASEIFTYNGNDVAFAPYSPHWKKMRRLCLSELLTPKKLEAFRKGRMEEIQCMVRSVYEDSKLGRVTNLRDTFGTLSSNTLTRMLLGKRYFGAGNAGPEQAAEHKAMIYEAFSLINAFNIGDYIPFLRRLDLQGHERRMKQIMGRVDEIYDAIIEEHRQKRKVGNAHVGFHDFVDILLDLSESGELELDSVKIKAILIDMVSAGTDTSSITSEWTLAELIRRPEIMQKVQKEIDSIVGQTRLVDDTDVNQFRYLRAVVKEVFRLHPVGALLIPHLAIENTKVAGYDIPKDTRVLINSYALGRNPSVWTNPTEFLPERFLAGNQDVDLNDAEFRIIPFGAGRRGCPGAPLGTCMVLLGLARLIHGFNWSHPTKKTLEDTDMVEACGIMVKAIPLQVIATPRLPLHLY